MIRVDYVCTRDINRVAKIHSSKKYANWNFKIVDGEYRFYPPIKVDEEEDYILKDILINNNRINLFEEKSETYLSLGNQLNTNSIQKKEINKPIENSKFIIKKDNLDIYQYPELTFSKEEIDK